LKFIAQLRFIHHSLLPLQHCLFTGVSITTSWRPGPA
jgi:hypothetical protein